MPLLLDDDLRVGVREMDAQHRRMAALLNRAAEILRSGGGPEAAGVAFESFYWYALSHFMAEERYFLLFDYPEAAAHRAEHMTLAERFTHCRTGFKTGGPVPAADSLKALADDLQRHIREHDLAYGPHFRDHGIR
jgi:hemerythrin-like metal-binding protein